MAVIVLDSFDECLGINSLLGVDIHSFLDLTFSQSTGTGQKPTVFKLVGSGLHTFVDAGKSGVISLKHAVTSWWA